MITVLPKLEYGLLKIKLKSINHTKSQFIWTIKSPEEKHWTN